MKKRSKLLILGLIPAALLLFNSCRKDVLNNLTAEESRIYITKRDSTADFSSFRTFSIVDSVAVIENGEAHKDLNQGDARLIQLITQQMESRGYAPVGKDQEPDLGINVTRISNTYLNVVQNPYSWWNFPGYWNTGYWGYPGYDYYFPPMYGYYYPPFQYYHSQEDIMAIDIIDLKNAQKDGKLEGIWSATLKGEGVLNSGNYEQQVKAVFDQSPYLKTS